MTPEERTELHMRMRTLTEAMGIAHSALRGHWEAVIEAEDVNPLAVSAALREVRGGIHEVQGALVRAIADLEIMAESPEVRPPVEHGDEVAF